MRPPVCVKTPVPDTPQTLGVHRQHAAAAKAIGAAAAIVFADAKRSGDTIIPPVCVNTPVPLQPSLASRRQQAAAEDVVAAIARVVSEIEICGTLFVPPVCMKLPVLALPARNCPRPRSEPTTGRYR